eukprot:CAMPEP_0177151724 /NCGR_PEP_ID=MMETSP0367-20130122/93_1 /TAXON_ID=447022 ORGANISM="Scrippsiella hangoei-like, Strain SHHI-4" /NCGR_SAMPLE_ID=MMETSP0367 /ASSEMBLY_ACC=CAM_ASM_000362 /LENGTH=47 /DNA_ID= /DNA_START= /DNA_END= /DNA_ORIENTATION=
MPGCCRRLAVVLNSTIVGDQPLEAIREQSMFDGQMPLGAIRGREFAM